MNHLSISRADLSLLPQIHDNCLTTLPEALGELVNLQKLHVA